MTPENAYNQVKQIIKQATLDTVDKLRKIFREVPLKTIDEFIKIHNNEHPELVDYYIFPLIIAMQEELNIPTLNFLIKEDPEILNYTGVEGGVQIYTPLQSLFFTKGWNGLRSVTVSDYFRRVANHRTYNYIDVVNQSSFDRFLKILELLFRNGANPNIEDKSMGEIGATIPNVALVDTSILVDPDARQEDYPDEFLYNRYTKVWEVFVNAGVNLNIEYCLPIDDTGSRQCIGNISHVINYHRENLHFINDEVVNIVQKAYMDILTREIRGTKIRKGLEKSMPEDIAHETMEYLGYKQKKLSPPKSQRENKKSKSPKKGGKKRTRKNKNTKK